MSNLYIFFTESIDPDDQNYLSYNAASNGVIEGKKIYKKDNLIFYYSGDFFEKEKGKDNYIKLVNLIIKQREIDISEYDKIYIFFHGSELEDETTDFALQKDKSNELTEKLERPVEAYYFTHSKHDPIYELLTNYKKVLKDYKIENIDDYIIKITFNEERIIEMINDMDKNWNINNSKNFNDKDSLIKELLDVKKKMI